MKFPNSQRPIITLSVHQMRTFSLLFTSPIFIHHIICTICSKCPKFAKMLQAVNGTEREISHRLFIAIHFIKFTHQHNNLFRFFFCCSYHLCIFFFRLKKKLNSNIAIFPLEFLFSVCRFRIANVSIHFQPPHHLLLLALRLFFVPNDAYIFYV